MRCRPVFWSGLVLKETGTMNNKEGVFQAVWVGDDACHDWGGRRGRGSYGGLLSVGDGGSAVHRGPRKS